MKLSPDAAAEDYGRKTAGLIILPMSWSPPFAALPLWIYKEWLSSHRISEALAALPSDLAPVIGILTTNGNQRLIIRSSAGAETLEQHGRYLSKIVDPKTSIPEVARKIETIYDHFRRQEPSDSLGIILQAYVEADLAGHMSNEVHLSPTKNQWKYEIEKPNYVPYVGLNSKDALFIDPEHPITIAEQSQLKNVFRMVGRWINEHVPRRTHFEWCLSGKSLWLVQLDTERVRSEGIDPRHMPAVQSIDLKEPWPSPKVFTLYEVATPTPWRKLQNVAYFNFGSQLPRHRLYFATGADVNKALNTLEGAADLCMEIDDLTNHRAVVRTELLTSDQTASLNLPRTQTVSGAQAVEWIREQLPGLVSKVANAANVCFILHGYIPARASAWSYFQPGDDIVEVDALWGLPDGLQFLPHDSFQVDARNGRILSEKIRCKPQVLQEQDDGSWRYVSVARQYSRYRSLSRRGVSYVAQQTVAIANRINERTQIMWFCDIPAIIQLGAHLPWYRSTTYAERTQGNRPPFRTFNISSPGDIELLRATDQKLILRILPEADLVRDESFLDAVIALAKEYSAPVELAGSVLGHAYYRFRNAGLMVFADEPYAAFYRVRGRKVFKKLVRDEIPRKIASSGEKVLEARLLDREAAIGLVAKLFEEAMEFASARTDEERKGELADVLEVVRGLVVAAGSNWDEVVRIAEEKRAARGGFDQHTVLLETSFAKPSITTKRKKNSAQMSLEQLGIIQIDGNTASVPFTRLMPTGIVGFTLPFCDGHARIVVGVDHNGLRLTLESHDSPDDQLGFSQLTFKF